MREKANSLPEFVSRNKNLETRRVSCFKKHQPFPIPGRETHEILQPYHRVKLRPHLIHPPPWDAVEETRTKTSSNNSSPLSPTLTLTLTYLSPPPPPTPKGCSPPWTPTSPPSAPRISSGRSWSYCRRAISPDRRASAECGAPLRQIARWRSGPSGSPGRCAGSSASRPPSPSGVIPASTASLSPTGSVAAIPSPASPWGTPSRYCPPWALLFSSSIGDLWSVEDWVVMDWSVMIFTP